MTKILLSFVALLFGPMAFAGTLVCEGSVFVSSVFMPVPMKRAAQVTITSDHFEGRTGKVVASIGGDPLEYKGPLFLDGKKNHEVVNELGEKAQFQLKLISAGQGRSLGFSMQMLAASNEVMLSVNPTVLSCLSK
ncbi:MAG: hypothetical protein KF789_04110 [Bdellovibrionaceae bacterium]|nr:hypothetical protein [Pseudobdellovibrionaceae bacterium]